MFLLLPCKSPCVLLLKAYQMHRMLEMITAHFLFNSSYDISMYCCPFSCTLLLPRPFTIFVFNDSSMMLLWFMLIFFLALLCLDYLTTQSSTAGSTLILTGLKFLCQIATELLACQKQNLVHLPLLL